MTIQSEPAGLKAIQQAFIDTGVKVGVGEGKTTHLACITLDIGGDRKVQLYEKKSWDSNVSFIRQKISEWQGLTEVVTIKGQDFVVVKPTLREASSIQEKLSSVRDKNREAWGKNARSLGSDPNKLQAYSAQLKEKLAEAGRSEAKLLSKDDINKLFTRLMTPIHQPSHSPVRGDEERGRSHSPVRGDEERGRSHSPVRGGTWEDVDLGGGEDKAKEFKEWMGTIRSIPTKDMHTRFADIVETDALQVSDLVNSGDKTQCRQFLEAWRKYEKGGEWKPSKEEVDNYRHKNNFGTDQKIFNQIWDIAFSKK